jgi:cell division protein FtsW
MTPRLQSDKVLLVTVVVLTLFGTLMVFSASAITTAEKMGSTHFLVRQVVWAVVGFLALAIFMHVDYRRLAKPGVVFTALAVQWVLLVAVFFAHGVNRSNRWLQLGPFSLQPSELAKLVTVLFLAYFLSARSDEIDKVKNTLLPVIMVSAVTMVLLLKEPDFGTALAIAMIVATMLYMAGVRLRYLAPPCLGALGAAAALTFTSPYRLERVKVFLDPYRDPLGAGFQIIQSFIAIGTGSFTGLGPMQGKQKLFFLPEPQTDFIFSVVSEELGFIGGVLLIAAFGVILWRGWRVSEASTCEFGRLLAIGLVVLIVGQAFLNISVTMGLVPNKGIPLPLVSYGGSSLVVTLAAVGILLNISQDVAYK